MELSLKKLDHNYILTRFSKFEKEIKKLIVCLIQDAYTYQQKYVHCQDLFGKDIKLIPSPKRQGQNYILFHSKKRLQNS